jgi:hypothetical protein
MEADGSCDCSFFRLNVGYLYTGTVIVRGEGRMSWNWWISGGVPKDLYAERVR